MAYESDLIPCSIVLAPGWTAEEVPEADGEHPYLAIRPRTRDARLRLTTFEPASTGIDAAAWVELAASVHPPKGRPLVPVRCGDFSGYLTQFETGDGRWLRGWVLHAGPIPLDATYPCALSDAGRDDAAVGAMLATLHLTRQH